MNKRFLSDCKPVYKMQDLISSSLFMRQRRSVLCGPATAGGTSQCHEVSGPLCAGMVTLYSVSVQCCLEKAARLLGMISVKHAQRH